MSIKYGIWGAVLALTGLVIYVASMSWHTPKEKNVSPQPNYSDVRIEILNGCGKDGIAGQLGTLLREQGFDVMTLGNADSFAFPETLVIDRVGKMRDAQQVAHALGTTNLIQQITPDPFRIEAVTIIIGRDYAHLPILKNQRQDPR